MRFGAAFALLLLLGACKRGDDSPIAGLHSAAAPVLLHVKEEKKALTVGSVLKPGDRITATGPAVLEYFGGATLFIEKGDELKVGETREAQLVSATVPEKKLRNGELSKLESRTRVMAARYADATFTPVESREDSEPTTGEHMRAFFAPGGMDSFLSGSGGKTGPGKLPPPPHREKVARIHAADLGAGGAVIKVTDEYLSAETDDLATAILREGDSYQLGRTVRLLLPDGADAELTLSDGKTIDLSGPLDLRLR